MFHHISLAIIVVICVFGWVMIWLYQIPHAVAWMGRETLRRLMARLE